MKCVCGIKLDNGKSPCCECEALVLSQKDCDKYLKLKEGKRVKNINDIKDKRQNHNQSK